jgi:O-antigen ligase
VILVFALFGIVQSAFLPGFAQLVYPDSEVYIDWDLQGHRLVSSFLDPNFAGAFVCIGLLCAIARLTCGERVAGWRIGVLATALLLTASRSSILAALVGLATIALIIGVSRRVARALLVFGALLVPTLPLLASFARQYGKLSIDASALARIVSWARALRIFGDHWLIGVGFNTYGFAQRAYGYDAGRGAFGFSLDGGLLFVAVMTGVVGTALYVGMLWRIGRRARRVWRAATAVPIERAMAVAAVASMTALLVHSLFVNSLLLPFLMEPMWILCALPAAAMRGDLSGRAA